jgi:hypothetical protein
MHKPRITRFSGRLMMNSSFQEQERSAAASLINLQQIRTYDEKIPPWKTMKEKQHQIRQM